MDHEAFYATSAQVAVTGLVALAAIGLWTRLPSVPAPDSTNRFASAMLVALVVVLGGIGCALGALAFTCDTLVLRIGSAAGNAVLGVLGIVFAAVEKKRLIDASIARHVSSAPPPGPPSATPPSAASTL